MGENNGTAFRHGLNGRGRKGTETAFQVSMPFGVQRVVAMLPPGVQIRRLNSGFGPKLNKMPTANFEHAR